MFGAVVDREQEADGRDLVKQASLLLGVEPALVVDGVYEGAEGVDGLFDLTMLSEDGGEDVGVVQGGGGFGEDASFLVADVRREFRSKEGHEVADLVDGDALIDGVGDEELEDEVELFEESREGGVFVNVAKVVIDVISVIGVSGGVHGGTPGRSESSRPVKLGERSTVNRAVASRTTSRMHTASHRVDDLDQLGVEGG